MKFHLSGNRISSLLVACLTLSVLLSAPHLLLAISVDTDNVAWPGMGTGAGLAEVVTSTNVADFVFHDVPNAGPPFTLSQSFQVPNAFDLNSIFVNYGNAADTDITVGLQIFEVADAAATTLPEAPDPGDILLDTTFTAPNEPDNTVMQIFLDNSLSLPMTTGSAGYAIRFTNEDEDFRWDRTGSSGGSVYAFGKAYEAGAEKSSGARDFSLGLSSQLAPPPPVDVFSIQSGNLNAGTTWDSGAPPADGFLYNVVTPHTVTVNSSSFAGEGIVVQSGGTLDLATSGADIVSIEVQPGGTLATSETGNFAIGDINASNLNKLILNETATFSATSGADLFVDVELQGVGDLNFESNGSASNLFITDASAHEGVIRFNGSGDEVLMLENEEFGTLEMNSTGDNRLVYDPTGQLTGGTLIFNQPGEIVHAATLGNRRLHGPEILEANAEVAVDLTTDPVTNERRLFVGDGLAGTADITVTGTPTDPTSGSITHNEFEVGGTGEPDELGVDDYSGTITGNDFVDFEIRRSQPNTRFVINNNARLEMGHRSTTPDFSVALGEVAINSGGTLEVGYEEDEQRNTYKFTLTAEGTRSGSLTLADGATTRMQVNGTADGEFDSISAQGDVAIDGTLELFVNPLSSVGTNPTYSPTIGDTFDIIFTAAASPDGDYDGSGTVDKADYDKWKMDFGSTTLLDADGNSNGVVDAADYAIWLANLGAVGAAGGTISGTFDLLTVVDPDNVMSTAGLAFQLNYVSDTLVQLEVVSALGTTQSTVPEASAFLLSLIAFVASGLVRRQLG